MATATQTWNRQQEDAAFKRILIATDFSDVSRRSLGYAVALARKYNAEAYVVHAPSAPAREPIPLEPLPKDLDPQWLEAEKQMKQFVEAGAMGDISHHDLLTRGPVADVLASLIESEHIDLLVLGTHGRGGLKKLVLGSVAEKMLRLVPCPVLTVGQNVSSEAGGSGFERILFATDFGTGGARALLLAVALAHRYSAKLTIVHMIPTWQPILSPPSVYGPAGCMADELMNWELKQRQECLAKLQQLLPRESKLMHEPEYVVNTDAPAEGILQAARQHDAALIVMGAHRALSPGAVAHLPWTFTHRVICEAECPVLTVRGPGDVKPIVVLRRI